jgi:sugar lactone lactonase YvrE
MHKTTTTTGWRAAVAGAVTAALFPACVDGGKGADCDESVPGSVALTVSAPDGVPSPTVALYSEAGERVGLLTAGQSLTDLPGGRYIAELLRSEGGVGALDFGVQEICVGGSDDEIVVEAFPQPAAGQLWATSWEAVHVFPPALDATTAAPAASLTIPFTNSFGGIAVDATGALWAAAAPTYGARIVALPAGALTGTAEVPPALELSAPSLAGDANFTSLSFDGDGNLWATTAPLLGGFVGVVGWSAATLREARLLGGLVEQEPTWAATVSGLSALNGGWVDAAGDLWATSADDEALVRVSADALRAATGGVAAAPALEPAARVRLVDADGNPFRGVESIAPGAEGQLYVLAAVSGAILSVPTSGVSSGGDLAVDALQLGVTALPTSLATDGTGGVWWSDTAELGHVSAAGGDGVRIEAPAIERAGVLLLDLP